jgi:hypothetical protein
MNYQKIYNQIVERAKNRQLEDYKERHHVIPRCLGGDNNKENLVELTAREHFLCHRLLCEIYPNNHKLWYALFLMAIGKQKTKKYHYVISSRLYEKIKIEWQSKVKNKPKPGGFMSGEIRQKISESNKGKSRNKGSKFSKETKQKISEAKKGKSLSKQHIENLKIGLKNRKKWIKTSKQVEQYDLVGNLIKIFNSSKEADIEMGGKGSNVADCCRGRQKTAYGFRWKYKD